MYWEEEKFSLAEPLFEENLENQKVILGIKNPDYAFSLITIAQCYISQSKFEKAEKMLLESLKIYSDNLGEMHKSYIANLSILANIYRINLSNQKAANYFEKHSKLSYSKIIEEVYGLSEEELIKYTNDYFNETNLNSTLSFIDKFPNEFTGININTCDDIFLIKNLSNRNRELINKSILKNNGSILFIMGNYKNIIFVHAKFSRNIFDSFRISRTMVC